MMVFLMLIKFRVTSADSFPRLTCKPLQNRTLRPIFFCRITEKGVNYEETGRKIMLFRIVENIVDYLKLKEKDGIFLFINNAFAPWTPFNES